MNVVLMAGALLWISSVVIVRAVLAIRAERQQRREMEAARRLLQQEQWRVSNLIEQRVYRVYGEKMRRSSRMPRD